MLFWHALLAAATLLASVTNAAVIVSGAAWTDTIGNVIQAHGGGLLRVGSTWYWVGEDKEHNSGLFRAVSCYTSEDLVTWSRQNNALEPIGGTMISTSNIVERPKVVYNAANNEYVMWFHSDSSNYGAAMVGVATSDTPCGPYTYQASWRPLGAESRDMGLYAEDDAVYLLYASDNNQNFKITQLDSDYYNVTEQVSQINGVRLESPGIVKKGDTYYLFGSHTTGWAPNPNKVFTSNSISGPWFTEQDIAPPANRTYYSQSTFILPLGDDAVYLGDRWRPQLLGSSRYVWYPLDFSGSIPRIVYADVWSIDYDAGTYTVAGGTTYEAEDGTLSGEARLASSSGYSRGTTVGFLGNGGSVTINNVQGIGQDQWIALYYSNGDSSYRNVTVSVNGGDVVYVDQPDTGGGQVTLSMPVRVHLDSGANSLTFGSEQTNYAGDLDKIIVYTAT